MTVAALHWLLLIPLLALLQYRCPQFGLSRPFRASLAILLVLALIEISADLGNRSLDLLVLVDRSPSAEQTVGGQIREWQAILEQSRPSEDSIRYIEFADSAIIRQPGETSYFQSSVEATRTALAVETALASANANRSNRLLLLSDGYSTEPLQGLEELLRKHQTALDYRLPTSVGHEDYRVRGLQAPAQVPPGENFLLEIPVDGLGDTEVPVDLYRDGVLLKTLPLKLKNGKAVLRLSDQLPAGAGAHRYRAVVRPKNDAHPGNNWAETWVEVRGPKQVLIISGYDDDPLYRLLLERGVPVKLVSKPSQANAGMLSGASVVVLNNIAAAHLPGEFLKSLEFYVRSQGGGLLMSGGKNSFGAGGYYQSAVDDLLPVSMELREDVWRQAATMALVLDRSGSMGASVAGNMGNMSKMDLANEGAARTISLLGERDYVMLNAVDTKTHEVIPLTKIGDRRVELMSKARSIDAGGGGIYVYTGVKDAWAKLKGRGTPIKHIIVFADAADAEEPGEYQHLVQEITAAGSSLSVIALGSPTDSDAKFLQDLALGGQGRCFFVSNAVDLPSVFAQETVSVVRSTFVKDPAKVLPSAGWQQISQFKPKWLAAVDGYNLNYLRPKASLVLAVEDEHRSPLFAVWQRGLGRTAALSAPIAGEYGARMMAWPEYGEVLHTLIEWLRGPELPVGLALRSEVVGSALFVDLFYDKSWEKQLSLNVPQLALNANAESGTRKVPWERLRPGHFRTRVELSEASALRGVVQVGKYGLPFGPISVGRSPEWEFDRQRIRDLKQLAARSGGGEVVELGQVWDAPRNMRRMRLTPYFLALFLVLFMAEALLARLDKQFSFEWVWLRELYHSRITLRKKEIVPEPLEEEVPQQPVAETEQKTIVEDSSEKQEQKPQDRKDRFSRAKRRGV